jgi:putative transcriptional regulator
VSDTSLAGHLLVATPVIGDPNFDRTVVFLLEHGADGALGLVVNRPTELEVGESLPEWAVFVAEPQVVFVGGPVEQAAAIGLGRPVPGAAPGADAGGDPVWSGIDTVLEAVGPLATLDLGADPGLAPGIDLARVYVGYAGWGSGQLEAELAQSAWVVATARPGDLWHPQPEELWGEVLRRQGGETAWLSLYPPDPSGN